MRSSVIFPSDPSAAGIDTPVWPLLQTVFTSILEVLLLCVAGYILAGRGILDKKTQKQMNRLNVSLFTPALLFSKVAFFLSPAKLKELWVIPIFFVIVTVLSMSVAFVLGTIFRLKRSQRSFAMAAAMFMNSNSLPIALMQSLVVTVPGLKWGHDDNKNAMVGRALTYLVLYSTLGMVLRWSYGVRLLAQADDEVPQTIIDAPTEHSPLLGHFDIPSTSTASNSSTLRGSAPTPPPPSQPPPPPMIAQTGLRPPTRRRSTFYASFPNSPNQSRVNLSTIPSSADITDSDNDDDEQDLLSHHHNQAVAKRSIRARIKRAWITLNEFMTVPLWAALASLIVACVQPLQHALDAHAQPIKGSLAAAGNCSIPVTLVVLGAYFYPPPKEPEEEDLLDLSTSNVGKRQSSVSLIGSVRTMFSMHTTNGDSTPRPPPVSREGETKTVLIAIASRMIITPLLLMPVVALSTKFNLQEVFDDPVFVVANVLLIASPPALTLAQITQAASGDAFERLISRTIFWSYCVLTPPTVIIYVVLGLVLAKL